MSDVPLGTEAGVPVEGVGELFWQRTGIAIEGSFAPKYSDATFSEWCEANEKRVEQGLLRYIPLYNMPSDRGFGLDLILPPDDEEPGYGMYEKYFDLLLGDERDGGYLIDASRPFPAWLIRFARDVQDWTRAEELTIDYDRIENGPENRVTMIFGYGDSHLPDLPPEFRGVPIKNNDIFIGTLALHLTSIYTESS